MIKKVKLKVKPKVKVKVKNNVCINKEKAGVIKVTLFLSFSLGLLFMFFIISQIQFLPLIGVSFLTFCLK